ncbi:hypothetical protein JI721_10635 [Alicyclobacillus cycloheptanicus]|uniref:Uncharacterized protein n=1 Tax=Alicyclobacillus cycloheptanicus TaxID=1457 RepID=A0ABT9XFJ6_9BACL|nr:hypothetical protein [Alicyclobacillus cycloheptanicus]MDQ0189067.1 hypothetical protein [Alicyclobacillus cycloheptanicus]WDM00203.1 hypothetical protein JI721_10635 [Alicyclobacillus cycloheptanicus]
MKSGTWKNTRMLTGVIGGMVAVSWLITTPMVASAKTLQVPQDDHWVAAWATSPQAPSTTGISNTGFDDQTIRIIVHPSADGKAIRLRFSNTFGASPLTLNDVSVGVSNGGASIVPGSSRHVTFDGQRSITIAPGTEQFSDPVPLPIKNGQNLTISIYVHGQSGPTTWHPDSLQTSYISTPGDFTSASQGQAFTTSVNSWFWLDGVDVPNPASDVVKASDRPRGRSLR